jgi:hypothetical protein
MTGSAAWVRPLALGVCGVFVLGSLAMVAVVVGGGQGITQQWVAVAFAIYAVVGYVVVTRRPSNPIGWLALATALIGGIFGLAQSVQEWARLRSATSSWWAFLAAWPQNWLWLPLILVSTTLPLLLLPDGRLLSRRWRWVAWAAAVLTMAYVVVNALAPSVGQGYQRNPLSPPALAGIGDQTSGALATIDLVLQLAFLLTILLAALSLVLRIRRSTGVERVQLRWIVFGGCVLAATFVLNLALPVPWGDAAITLGLAAFSFSLGVAVLRFRLYDIDRVISRTVTYALVSGVAFATYAAVVTSFARLVPSGSSSLVVAGATLAAAAVVRPVRIRLQDRVDRRFNRERIDGLHEVECFAERLRSQTDEALVTEDLVGVARRTWAPSSASVWTVRGGT